MLDHRIPPPVVGLLAAVAMWFARDLAPALPLPGEMRGPLAVLLALAGAAFDASGLLSFLRARTTVNPLRPGKASALVTGGIYRITRNPMYVGMAFLLAGWTAWLGSAWGLLGPVAFVAWITRFQILPEERILRAKFGADYDGYRRRVRRWL